MQEQSEEDNPAKHAVDSPEPREGLWRSFFSEYLADPAITWASDSRQGNKLKRAKARAKAALARAESDDSFFERFTSLVSLRRQKEKVPLHVLNIGGCGSHWLCSMLEDTGQWLDAGEVYLPPAYENALGQLSAEDADAFLDAVDLLHAYIRPRAISPTDALERSLINSAHGIPNFQRINHFRKNGKSIHLIRDPRDRTLSVTYRKNEFRSFHRPGMDDWNYLVASSRRTEMDYERYERLPQKADAEARYEDVRKECVSELARILSILGFATDREQLNKIAFAHKAENLASGASAADSRNLNVTSIGSDWRSHPSDADRSVMHAIMAPAIWGGSYPLCDCSGAAQVETEGFPVVTSACPILPGIKIDVVGPGEVYWRPAVALTSERAMRVRLCASGQQNWANVPAGLLGTITDICFAAAKSCSFAEVPFEKMKNLRFVDISGHNVENPTRLPATVRQIFATGSRLSPEARNALGKDVAVVELRIS